MSYLPWFLSAKLSLLVSPTGRSPNASVPPGGLSSPGLGSSNATALILYASAVTLTKSSCARLGSASSPALVVRELDADLRAELLLLDRGEGDLDARRAAHGQHAARRVHLELLLEPLELREVEPPLDRHERAVLEHELLLLGALEQQPVEVDERLSSSAPPLAPLSPFLSAVDEAAARCRGSSPRPAFSSHGPCSSTAGVTPRHVTGKMVRRRVLGDAHDEEVGAQLRARREGPDRHVARLADRELEAPWARRRSCRPPWLLAAAVGRRLLSLPAAAVAVEAPSFELCRNASSTVAAKCRCSSARRSWRWPRAPSWPRTAPRVRRSYRRPRPRRPRRLGAQPCWLSLPREQRPELVHVAVHDEALRHGRRVLGARLDAVHEHVARVVVDGRHLARARAQQRVLAAGRADDLEAERRLELAHLLRLEAHAELHRFSPAAMTHR